MIHGGSGWISDLQMHVSSIATTPSVKTLDVATPAQLLQTLATKSFIVPAPGVSDDGGKVRVLRHLA
jgi:hypothetical protein